MRVFFVDFIGLSFMCLVLILRIFGFGNFELNLMLFFFFFFFFALCPFDLDCRLRHFIASTT